MNEYTICTDFAEIMSGTNNVTAPAYTEAVKSMDAMDDKAMKQMKEILTSMDKVAADRKSREPSITESKGNIKNFKGYKDIQTVMGFLNKFMSGDPVVKDLKTILDRLEDYQTQYSEGCRVGISLISLEYENSVYLLVTGLSWIMATKVDVSMSQNKPSPFKKNGNTHGLIPKLCHELAVQLNSKGHREYLEGLIKGNSDVGSLKESMDEFTFTEGLKDAVSALNLIDNIVGSIKKIGSSAVGMVRAVKNSIFGIVPLIRSVLYLKYKKKADTVLALEQQARFIEMNIEQLNNIQTMDPVKKATIIKKQQAVIEAYKKKAEKLRAELSETEKEAATAIQKIPAAANGKSSKSDEDFVLESIGYHDGRREREFEEGFLDIFRKKKQKNTPTTTTHTSSNINKLDPEVKTKVDMAIAEFIDITGRDAISFSFTSASDDNNPADRLRSKLGGIPYWPANMKWPTNNGNAMRLLVQINFSEIPHLTGYPSSGIFQFFTVDMEYPFKADHGRVVYHPNPNKEIAQLEVVPASSLDLDYPDEDLPFTGVHFINNFKIEKIPMQDSCNEFNSTIEPILRKYLGSYSRDTDHNVSDYVYRSTLNWGNRIGGWPNFTQNDMMDSKYNRLLLQIDSEEPIVWGDYGVGNFFINDRALANSDFSDVLCTWDCH